MTDHRTALAAFVLVAALGGLVVGCGATDEPSGAASEPAPASSTPEPTPEPATGCGDDLDAAVRERSPGYGEVAVDRCDRGWAYVGAKEGRGDTEQVWRAADDRWTFVTGQPSELCPADLQEQGAPPWVVDLFAYREYAC